MVRRNAVQRDRHVVGKPHGEARPLRVQHSQLVHNHSSPNARRHRGGAGAGIRNQMHRKLVRTALLRTPASATERNSASQARTTAAEAEENTRTHLNRSSTSEKTPKRTQLSSKTRWDAQNQPANQRAPEDRQNARSFPSSSSSQAGKRCKRVHA
jgi:hypothetical protein